MRNQPAKVVTVKAKKEFENAAAIGGMRNPAAAVGLAPGLRAAGIKVPRAIEDFCAAHPQLLRDIVHSAGVKDNCVDASTT